MGSGPEGLRLCGKNLPPGQSVWFRESSGEDGVDGSEERIAPSRSPVGHLCSAPSPCPEDGAFPGPHPSLAGASFLVRPAWLCTRQRPCIVAAIPL